MAVRSVRPFDMPNVKVKRQSFTMPVAGESVPAILQLPSSEESLPAVLLLHGFSSRKERMADSIGRALAARRVASLAIDLPLHGARDAGFEGMSFQDPVGLIQNWRLAVREAHAGLALLAVRDGIDAGRIGIAGYSLGAFSRRRWRRTMPLRELSRLRLVATFLRRCRSHRLCARSSTRVATFAVSRAGHS